MIKYLLILLLIFTQLFGHKLKAKQKSDNVYVTVLLQKDVKAKQIKAFAGERVVFDVYLNKNFSKKQFFKFNYTFKNYSDTIKIVITDIDGKKESFEKKIISSKYNNNSTVKTVKNRHSLELKQEWNDKIIKNAITNKVFLRTIYPYSNTLPISIGIKSQEDLEYVVILQRNRGYSVKSIFTIPIDTKIKYKTYINIEKSSNIVILSKSTNGQWYKDDVISMFTRECKNNNEKSCTYLAMIYNFADIQGIGSDIEKSEEFSIKGCNLGSAYACALVKHHFGNEGEESLNAQVQLCEHNSAQACNKLGRHYLRDKKDTWVIKNNRYYLKKDVSKALHYFQKACKQDSACCNEVLVEMAKKELSKEK